MDEKQTAEHGHSTKAASADQREQPEGAKQHLEDLEASEQDEGVKGGGGIQGDGGRQIG